MDKYIALWNLVACMAAGVANSETMGVNLGTYPQEISTRFDTTHGLASQTIYAVIILSDNSLVLGTAAGLVHGIPDNWKTYLQEEPIYKLAQVAGTNDVIFAGAHGLGLFHLNDKTILPERTPVPPEISEAKEILCIYPTSEGIWLGTTKGIFFVRAIGTPCERASGLVGIRPTTVVRAVTIGPNGKLVVATQEGVFIQQQGTVFDPLYPELNAIRWYFNDARAAAFDSKGRLWLAAPQGVACLEGHTWHLFTGKEGLPYNDFTCLVPSPTGEIWLGTTQGIVRYDGKRWAYRQGKRWLPDDYVHDVAVSADGSAWIATPQGLGKIFFQPMTLAEKAKFFEDEIDKYHRRTEFEFVLGVSVARPGDKSEWTQHDSDNDGLWTSMYGAGECFAYAATKDPLAKQRAQKAFRALKFLGEVTQGGSHPAPKGFVARTVLPTSGPNPNETEYTPEKDRERQQRDKYWKVIVPRWPTSADGKWYWKCDTSSDELDGHYFFYAQYYDLVAESEEEKAAVREHVRALTDHLIEHNFCLVDHDGKPTRWAVYCPEKLNNDPNWYVERGLNSLSILSYLAVAEHMTGDPKYRDAANMLIREHHYAQNLLVPKIHTGIGSGNQSDDEMAFMCYYNILKYEKDPELRALYAFSLYNYWRLEEPEANPFFNFIFAASALGKEFSNIWGSFRLTAETDSWLHRSIEELLRFPLDRFNWAHTNSHRLDIVPLPKQHYLEIYAGERPHGKGYRVDGYVIPVDERYYEHHNHDPWALDIHGDGRYLASGASFLLPYYMGLYHGFIREQR